MPKNKKDVKQDSSDSDSDSGPEDRGPAKKPKSDVKKKEKDNDEDNNSWSLGKNRYVKLTEFKNNWYIDVREFYNADGELKPGRKGIMLTMEQWQKFKSHIDDIDEAIKKNV